MIHQLRSESKGTLLAYSVEVDEAKVGMVENPLHSQIVEEMIRSIDAAADYEDSLSTPAGRSTWVAIKLVSRQPAASNSVLTPVNPDIPASRFSGVG